MTPLSSVLFGAILSALSGVPGLFGAPGKRWGQWVATGTMVCASLFGIIGTVWSLSGAPDSAIVFSWQVVGNVTTGLDALSAFFLIPVFLMAGLGSIYGLGYWPQRRHPSTARKLQLFWGLMTTGMVLLVVSRHAMVFLFGWEIMALSAFFLVSTEDHNSEVRMAGWIYFIATHLGTLALFGFFALWRSMTGSFFFHVIQANAVSLWGLYALFFLALAGFGVKAGIMPFHFWLPGAHANAPSHVSAMLSGIVLKMGIYALVRFISLLPTPPISWGALVIILGGISGLLGVAFALAQHDLKRFLAYHSVENIGIILMGLGLAMVGRSTGQTNLVALGLAGCLLHVWNHSFFKSLLFFAAGSVVHTTHTRQIDLLGGLAQRMPWTSGLFLVGAVAICGLPPLNGFVSELLIYLGALNSVTTVSLIAPVLAMIGGLALACFVKVYGAVFLGSARSANGAYAHEAPWSQLGPMVILALLCAVIGLLPELISPALDRVIACWVSGSNLNMKPLGSLFPFNAISTMTILLTACIIILLVIARLRCKCSQRVVTWDCGYACPTSRMQYTSSSFARSIVNLFRWVLRPVVRKPNVNGLFPKVTEMHTQVNDVVLDRILIPTGHSLERIFSWFRRFQVGLTQYYVFYIIIALLLLLLTLIPFKKLLIFLITN